LKSRKVVPERLLMEGFAFEHDRIEPTLENLVNERKETEHDR